jgi:hypothetical protein
VVSTFASRACELLQVDDLGPVALLGSSDVEVGRALAIAQALLNAGLSALKELPAIADTDLSRPMAAHDLVDRIRHFGYEQNRIGDEALRDSAFTLADLAKAVDKLEAALGWDPDACLAIAEPAALVLPLIESRRGPEAAVWVAHGAVTAAA